MRGQQHRHPLTARQPGDLLPHGGPGLRVQARRRLVEEQHRGPVHQPERHVQAALHAAGIGLDQPSRRICQPEVREQLVRAGPHGAAAQPVQAPLQDQVLPAGGGRVGAGPLRDDPDHVPDLARPGEHVDALDAGHSGVRPGQRGENLHGGALARSVRSEQSVDHAARDADVQPVQRPDAVLLSLPNSGYGVGLY